MVMLILISLVSGCQSVRNHRHQADKDAQEIIREKKRQLKIKDDGFSLKTAENRLRERLLVSQKLQRSGAISLGAGNLEVPKHIKDKEVFQEEREKLKKIENLKDKPLLELQQVLQIAARNSPLYQDEKEELYEQALALDLERNDFNFISEAALDQTLSSGYRKGRTESGLHTQASIQVSKQLKSGPDLRGGLSFDLVKLLTLNRASASGLVLDSSISIPLLRGANHFVVTEPLRQSERDMIYAVYGFERFKKVFAVKTASAYLNVLAAKDQVKNANWNYKNLLLATRRARQLAKAGRLPEIQVDQALQDELRARERWVRIAQNFDRQLDVFKKSIGIPVDADISLDNSILNEMKKKFKNLKQIEVKSDDINAPIEELQMPEGGQGEWELNEKDAISMAFDKRLDLLVKSGKVHDAVRKISVAADQLRADLTLLGQGSFGARRSLAQAGLADAGLRADQAELSALLHFDLPFERTSERRVYRLSWMAFQQSIRSVQSLEDKIKLDIRNGLRNLLETREAAKIQMRSVEVAKRRVSSTELFLQAGRTEIRNLLEAQESLLEAENAFTNALIRHRVAEWNMQLDTESLQIDRNGLMIEKR